MCGRAIFRLYFNKFRFSWQRSRCFKPNNIFISAQRVSYQVHITEHQQENNLLSFVCPVKLVLMYFLIWKILKYELKWVKGIMFSFKVSCIIPSIFLLPVHGSRSSIYKWILILSHLLWKHFEAVRTIFCMQWSEKAFKIMKFGKKLWNNCCNYLKIFNTCVLYSV